MELIAIVILEINILAAIGVFWLRPASRDLVANGAVRLESSPPPGTYLPHTRVLARQLDPRDRASAPGIQCDGFGRRTPRDSTGVA